MIRSNILVDLLIKQGFNFVTGVPGSILKNFLARINDNNDIERISATSEGEACAIASGYYLATNKIPIVYMQNSGLGNSVDALTSLMNKEVYNIPALLLISWRGQPRKKDEPQHLKMGKITLRLLKTLGIPYSLLPAEKTGAEEVIKKAKQYFKKCSLPYAVIIRKGMIESYQPKKREKDIYSLTREQAIKTIVDNLDGKEIIISTTGKTSRELFECREIRKQSHKTDFYTVGSMGCSAGIALGIALKKPKRKIFVFDGDGSILMKMGTLATIGYYSPRNFYHIIFDNNAHDSTGGQRTVSDFIDFSKVALACGYKSATVVSSKEGLVNFIKKIRLQKSPGMLVIKVKKGSRKDLGRPTKTPLENKIAFMKFLKD